MIKIELEHGGVVTTDNCAYYDVYMLIVNKEEKQIEINDSSGFAFGLINYEDENVEALLYRVDGTLDEAPRSIAIDGEIQY